MGYKSRIKSPKGAIHEYRNPLREKGKNKKRIHRRIGRSIRQEKHTATEREVSEGTLRRLHTLGSQKFGSSPFSEHFDRWLTNVAAVLSEFESNPNISVDDQFERERLQTLSIIKQQLEDRRLKEASLYQEIKKLSDCGNHLEQINMEYATMTRAIKARKNREIKRLYNNIDRLRGYQDKAIRVKTGFFHGISRKDMEQKEIEIAQELNDRQKELELIILGFNAAREELRDEYKRKMEPVFEQKKQFQKMIENTETDGSLEDRWFACEALIDEVNTFLQRKATQPL